MRVLAITAAALLFAGAAYAQSALPTPGQPGSGYKAPESQPTMTPQTSKITPVPGQGTSTPGAGYKIPETQQKGAPSTSGLATPGQPGSGYQTPDKKQ
jgi:hypothetical protein